MRAEIPPVLLDDLARHRRGIGHGEHVREAQVGALQTDAQRVTVDDLEARDRRVVIEFARLEGLGADLVRTNDLALDRP
jgi:hypothetical protein